MVCRRFPAGGAHQLRRFSSCMGGRQGPWSTLDNCSLSAALDEYGVRRNRLTSKAASSLLTVGLGRWERYLHFLVIVLDRYEQKSPEMARMMAALPNHATDEPPSGRLEQRMFVAMGMHLEIESVYTFVKVLLDRIGDTLHLFLTGRPPAGGSHRRAGSSYSL
jgi:hypothetical protein